MMAGYPAKRSLSHSFVTFFFPSLLLQFLVYIQQTVSTKLDTQQKHTHIQQLLHEKKKKIETFNRVEERSGLI